jgi:hypothetical protein
MIIGAASLAAGATLFAAGGAAVGHWVVVIAGNPAAIAAALADSSCGLSVHQRAFKDCGLDIGHGLDTLDVARAKSLN